MDMELLAGQDWGEVYKRVTLYAYRRLSRVGIRDMELAQDLAQESVRRLYDPEYADWDRERHPELMLFLGSTVNGMVSNLRRKRSRRGDRWLEDMPGNGARFASEQPGVERRLAARQKLHLVLRALDEALGDDELARAVLEQLMQGKERAAVQAEELQVDVQKVYRARRRLKAHIARYQRAAELRDDEGEDHGVCAS